ncbi:UDP-N-acetylglucosamine 4,6-dehydratase family protein [Metabacillus elymi]|uniref:Polysaccharide biosynthesis protein n=1 Tax=Metabacillus elymi TaxID=2745198 RepID=A0ABX6S326_9BACI|nr:UDP-N-acetylglucosamine 4,6-dehydratase family protein [Metabacillus sp. KUDC1714]QNF28479.1 polysaccharide biosynthesis protein [Metabacillus sp. KUDC1714]
MFRGKNILVTGGTGSIGSEIVRQLLSYNPNVLRVYSRDESKQFELKQELSNFDNVRYLIGDIRDRVRLKYACENIDYIFHAAALKHVPACEYNPFEAVKTNVIGVQNIIDVSINSNVQKLVGVSTDKVVNPTNTMGATKLLSEKLLLAGELYKGYSPVTFSCVRFGNVMGSRGSVIPLFKKQIEENKPVTITSNNMTRFMMSIPQAVKLIIDAMEYSVGGEIFVLKMPVLNIKDMAEVLIHDYNHKNHNKYTNKIVNIGVRPGEKEYEELMTISESERAYENENLYIIPSLIKKDWQIPKGFTKVKKQGYSSKNSPLLTKEDIYKLLSDQKLLF